MSSVPLGEQCLVIPHFLPTVFTGRDLGLCCVLVCGRRGQVARRGRGDDDEEEDGDTTKVSGHALSTMLNIIDDYNNCSVGNNDCII